MTTITLTDSQKGLLNHVGAETGRIIRERGRLPVPSVEVDYVLHNDAQALIDQGLVIQTGASGGKIELMITLEGAEVALSTCR